jgi:hypothetical protein
MSEGSLRRMQLAVGIVRLPVQVLAPLHFDLMFFTNLSSLSYSKIGKKAVDNYLDGNLKDQLLQMLLRLSSKGMNGSAAAH